MARIRTIKPEFFLHDGLAELPALHRLLFIGLWTQADREGRMDDRPKRIKAGVLPYDDCDIEAMLADLERYGFIRRYRVGGEAYIAIPGFLKHQNPHVNEKPSTIPDYADSHDPGMADEHRTSTVQAPDKHGAIREERKGRERKDQDQGREGETPAAPPAKRASRLPDDWTLPDEWAQWAEAERPDWSPADVQHVGATFRDHWLAQGGQNARKVDWEAAWRNWVRRERAVKGGSWQGNDAAVDEAIRQFREEHGARN